MAKTEKLILAKDGTVRGIHGPLVDKVTRALGEPIIRRASHVEPGSELSDLARDQLSRERSPVMLDGGEWEGRPGFSKVRWRLRPEFATKWFADMHPCGQAVVLGPFDSREEALKAETDWLLAHHIPVPNGT